MRSSYQTRTLCWKHWWCLSSEVLFVATLTRRNTSGRYPSSCGSMSWNKVASTCANPSSLRKPTSWFGQEAKKKLSYSNEQVFRVAAIHSESHLRTLFLCAPTARLKIPRGAVSKLSGETRHRQEESLGQAVRSRRHLDSASSIISRGLQLYAPESSTTNVAARREPLPVARSRDSRRENALTQPRMASAALTDWSTSAFLACPNTC